MQLLIPPLLAQKKIYMTKRVNPAPPVINGRMDDSVWESVDWEGNFIQREPYDGKAPTQKTSFKILYDDNNIYVGIRAWDNQPDSVVARLSRRDEIEGDVVAIQLDSYLDHLTAFTFIVSASGVKIDGIFSNDGENEDYNWDPVWYVQTAIDDQGWCAEMQIPFNQLRFGTTKNPIWGLQLARFLFRKEELSLWQPIPQDASGWVHLFGELHGIKGISPGKRIELLPYSMGKLETLKKEEGNPFVSGHLKNMNLGLDGKIGITSDLTVDFTINPDFGQVEADPSVVNLTAFETFYEEKRPFFIEGNNILNYRIMLGDGDFSYDNLFYSRRIGRYPSHEPDIDDDEYMKMPESSSIISALKLSGKTRNGLSIGVMNAVTAKERAEIDFNGQRRHESVEPLTNYFIARLQQDFNKSNTIVGGIVTSTYRDIKDSQLEFLNTTATTGGFDFKQQWKDKTYYLTFNTVFSHIRCTREAILEAQTASTRYFQRPDADHVTLDSSRTSLSGYGGTLLFGKEGKGHINFIVGATWRSPGLELNDMGYLRRADAIMEFGWVQYRYWEPFSIFRSFSINFNQWKGWNFGKENIFDGGNVNLNTQLRNYWYFGMGIGYNAESLSASATRGGPSLLFSARWSNWFDISTDSKKAFQFSLNGSNSWSHDGNTRYHSINPGVTWRPTNAFSLSFKPFYNINKDDLQYIDTIERNEGDHYIFGRIDQKTLGIVLRFDYCLTPTLTIQYYGQPFVSAGKYVNFKRITEPRAESYESRFNTFVDDNVTYDTGDEAFNVDYDGDGTSDYSFDDPNFNFRQFRSNLVIRWEYTPGSTLYLVWSQDRVGDSLIGDFSYRSDMRALFDIYPHNVFLIKFNHWFSW